MTNSHTPVRGKKKNEKEKKLLSQDLNSIKLPGSAYGSCVLSEGRRELTALSLRPLRWEDKGHMEEGA